MPQLLLNCQGSLGLRHATKAWNVLPNSHFGTNDPVQECQIPGVRTFIRNARSRKSRLDEKIASLEAALNELYSERDALDEAICNHVVALSPIRRMPTEILSLIFSLVLANDVKFDYRVDSAPWTLIAVCACWRSVALSPIFWTRISNWQRHFSLEKLEVILNRSASLPLQIHFHSDDVELLSAEETRTLELVLQHCERWELLSSRVLKRSIPLLNVPGRGSRCCELSRLKFTTQTIYQRRTHSTSSVTLRSSRRPR
ncbi:hypothetical protein FB45DRAFT_835874 [Roridomyces roridus]|uniref:F-box domain-containing protein n=1 Tax=Roridomyces roridus TaxID=1738132 RepID=A0AAD7BMM8_9AGAR|nr:hypothetical protein FB45DRAFT_835874 [Roridomyces roridus]